MHIFANIYQRILTFSTSTHLLQLVFQVYQGVIPDFPEHVTQLSLGTSVALEVRAQSAVQTFRETAGPWDVEMAKVSEKAEGV